MLTWKIVGASKGIGFLYKSFELNEIVFLVFRFQNDIVLWELNRNPLNRVDIRTTLIKI